MHIVYGICMVGEKPSLFTSDADTYIEEKYHCGMVRAESCIITEQSMASPRIVTYTVEPCSGVCYRAVRTCLPSCMQAYK